MGRKKKRKKQRGAQKQTGPSQASSSAEVPVAESPRGHEAVPETSAAAPARVSEPPPTPPAAPEQRSSDASVPTTPTHEPPPAPRSAREEPAAERPAEDLDADLDEDDASYESLVALVASMPDDDAPPAPRTPSTQPSRDPKADEEIEVVDLDDEEGVEALDRLIAKAVVGAAAEEVEEEPEAPVIDLDADEPAVPTQAPAAGASPIASSEAARLALAAARGAIDEDGITSFSIDEDVVSTPEARARLLAEALAHAEHKEARYRVPTDTGAARRWKAVVASVVFVLAGWTATSPPGWVRPEPPAQLNAPTRARSIRSALLLQAQQVEAFRVRTQRLPTTLDELPASLPGIGYARSGNRAYQLIGYEPNGSAIIFDSSDPMPAFRALMSTWPPAEEER